MKIRNALSLIAALTAGLAAASPAHADKAKGKDLIATGLEVTQSVQTLANDVPLVTGKNTWVRVYARVTTVDGTDKLDGITARLVASRIAPGPVTFLGFLDSEPVTIGTSAEASRLSPGRSFDFNIPPSWRSGTVQMVAVVDFHDDVSEASEVNNALLSTVTFEPVPPLRLRVYGVEYPGGTLPPPVHETRLRSWLSRVYPTASVLYQPRTLTTPIAWPNDQCTCTRDDDGNCGNVGVCPNDPGRPCDSDLDCGCARLNDQLTTMRNFDKANQPGTFDPDRRYVAMVHDDGGFMRGCSPGVDRKVAAGPAGPGDFGWDFDGSYADWYTGHEIGHALGRPHATCCGAEPNPGDVVFPYDMCLIGETDNAVVGFDTSLHRTYTADWTTSWTDMMSYCDAVWLSDFTYEALLDQLVEENGAPPPPPPVLGDYVLVQGSKNAKLGSVRITSVVRMDDAWANAPRTAGDLLIELYDAAGGLAATHAAATAVMEDDADLVPDSLAGQVRSSNPIATFAEVLPVPAGGLSRIAIVESGVEVASREGSANPPTVLITSPAGGESVDDGFEITWTAGDPDGDALEFFVLYSTDAGATWETIAAGITDDALTFDRKGLAGGTQVLLRVVASDGFHSASDDSDGVVTVPDADPSIVIVAPAGGATLAALQTLSLEASADDADDGVLGEGSVVWTSDRQGALGQGSSLTPALALVPGTHLLTATATDSQGNTASDSIEVVVGSAAADACGPSPREDCDEGRGKMTVRTGSDGRTKHQLYRLFGGADGDAATLFGDPTTSTAHTLCIYENGLLTNALALPAPGPGWHAVRHRGFSIVDRSSTSVQKAVLTAGTADAPKPARILVKGEGDDLPDLRLPATVPLHVQLVNDTDTSCFSAAFHSLTKNGSGVLQAKE
ncbi:MAG TPA: hypothetical protein VEL28_18845 [Candidatus Binatia bacterium]|nr:hypothetical protein [Candidatus Binatia bacterium]